MAYLGLPARARDLAGHPTDGTGGSNAEVTTAQMDDALNYGHSMLVLYTGKSDWGTGDQAIDQVRRIEEHFAASYIKSWWRDPDNKSQELFNRARSMITAIQEDKHMSSSLPSDRVGYVSVVKEYQTANAQTALLNQTNKLRYTSPRVDV
jgi:hypothetical protein